MGVRCYSAFIAVFSALGAFLFGLDIGYIAPILECADFKRDVAHLLYWQDPASRIPDATVGFIVAVFSIGCIFTSFPSVSAYFLDYWGRRSSIIIGSFVFLVGSTVQATASSIATMVWGRMIAGMSIGLLSSVVSLYQSELAPANMRGALTSLYQLMITFGILVAAAADQVLVEREGGWRLAIWFQALPAGCLLLVMPFLPRSPRWLVQRGRIEEALAALEAVREKEEAQEELKEIIANHEQAVALGEPQWAEFFEGRISKLLLLGVTLQLLQQLVGMNAFMYFGPRIFASLGLNAALFQTIINAVNFIATFPALFIVDRFGRRVLFISSAVGMCVACIIMGTAGHFSARQSADGSWTSNSELGSVVIISMVFLFVVNFAYGWGPVTWVYNSEIFPLKYRSWCVSATACANWVGNFVIAQFTPVLLGSLGYGTFYIFAVFCFFAWLVAVWLPETRGVTLEHMDEVFEEKFGKPETRGDKKCGDSGTAKSLDPVCYGSAAPPCEDTQGLVNGRVDA